MTEQISRFAGELATVFLQASPYILLGFVVAAGIQILLPVRMIQKFLGRGRARSIVAASLLGIPLPLCSCSVLPTAIALRKRGAGRGATVSFLVSTPETGVDSIALTYGLMDPLMAVYRPFAALVSALTAGFATEAFGEERKEDSAEAAPACDHCPPVEDPVPSAHSHAPGHDALAGDGPEEEGVGIREKLARGFRGAFVEIFDETSHWMFGGLVISALIAILLPAEVVTRHLSSGPVPMLLMLVIGIPLYICASASTPIAAALVLKGLSPGAALVFLLAGPATNIGSLAILSRFLGRRVMLIYIGTIAGLSLALGALLDVIYRTLALDPGASAAAGKHLPMGLAAAAAAIFAALLVFSFRRTSPPGEFLWIGRGIERVLGFRVTRGVLGKAAGAMALAWMLSSIFVTVPPGHRALLKVFGAPYGDPRGEGIHLRWPAPFGGADLMNVEGVRRIELGFRSADERPTTPQAPLLLEGESLFLTGDENLVDTKSVLQYRITDPVRYAYAFDDPERVIRGAAVAELLETVASLDIDGIYTVLRPEVERRVLEGLRRRCAELDLGVELVRFSVLDVHAPPEVHAAFRDVASAQEDKQTAINVARRYRVETVNLSRGEAAREVEVARGFSDAEVRRAEGGSVSLAARAGAYRERPVGNRTRLYLETMESVLAGSRKIVRPSWPGSGGVDLWISAGEGAPLSVEDVLTGEGGPEAPRAGGK